MEQFLVAILGSVSVLLALILGSQYRARSSASERPQPPAAADPNRPERRSPTRRAAVAIAVLAALLVVGGVAYARLSILQRRSFEAQTAELAAQRDALQQQLAEVSSHQHRAWVYATPSLNGPLIIKGRSVSLAARYKIENSGDAPAADTRIAAAVVPHVGLDVRAVQKSLCDGLAAGDGAAAPARDTLLPGQSVEVTRVEGSDAELPGFGAITRGGPEVKFWWVGCLSYKSAGMPAGRRTGFVYEIAETGAGPHGVVAISLADQIIPKSRLVILPYRGGGFAAN